MTIPYTQMTEAEKEEFWHMLNLKPLKFSCDCGFETKRLDEFYAHAQEHGAK